MPSANYLTALDRLCQPIRGRDYPNTLQPMRDLLAAMGDPQQGLRAVVVAGSTGKGTTCAEIAQRLEAKGLHVGLYTSPHLHSFRERFVVNGQMIDPATFVTGVSVVTQAANKLGRTYSTFEAATALALWWFDQQRPDIAVLEIGLGGRWDAVNVVDHLLAVFTPIEAEHVAMLGGTLETVAEHKAGIIRPQGYAVTVPQSTVVDSVLRRECEAKNTHLAVVENGTLARSACENLAARGLIQADAVAADLTLHRLPGRLERIEIGGRTIMIDGGHTPLAARHLLDEIEHLSDERQPIRLIVGLLNDKNARAYLQIFDSPHFHITLTQGPGHRAAKPGDIASQTHLERALVKVIPDLNAALRQAYDAPEPLVVVAGSLRMAAAARETYGLLTEDELAEARATRAIFEGVDYLAKLSDHTDVQLS